MRGPPPPPAAPGPVTPADEKRWTRVAVVRTVGEAVESALRARGIAPDPPLPGAAT